MGLPARGTRRRPDAYRPIPGVRWSELPVSNLADATRLRAPSPQQIDRMFGEVHPQGDDQGLAGLGEVSIPPPTRAAASAADPTRPSTRPDDGCVMLNLRLVVPRPKADLVVTTLVDDPRVT